MPNTDTVKAELKHCWTQHDYWRQEMRDKANKVLTLEDSIKKHEPNFKLVKITEELPSVYKANWI